MAITYTWKLTSLKKIDKHGLEEAIFQTYWKKIGTDEDGNEGEFSGATPFDISKVDPNEYIPYNELTEEIVLGWIKPVVVNEYEKHVNEQIQKAIDAKKYSTVEVQADSMPWIPEEDRPKMTPPPIPAQT
jgi:hypothetical protein